jgi:hypothetical protein
MWWTEDEAPLNSFPTNFEPNPQEIFCGPFSYRRVREPVSVAERSEASTVFGRSNVEISGSNPARGMDVCLRFSVLCCPVYR